MNTSEIFRLAHRFYQDGETNSYVDIDPQIREALSRQPGLKTSFLSHDALRTDELKLSVVFSDITSIYGNSGPLIGVDSLDDSLGNALPDDLLQFVARQELGTIRKISTYHQFAFYSEEVFDALQPLADAGRVIMRPIPEIRFVVEGEEHSRRLGLEPGFLESVLLSNADAEGQMPLMASPSLNQHEREIQSMLVPYIENVSISDLAKILDDEEHALLDLRSSIKNLVQAARSSDVSTSELFDDTVRPALHRIQRRFKSIVQIHGLRVGGATISTSVLSLVAMTDVGIGANLAKVLGPAGLGLIAKEYAEFLKAKIDAKEMPFYLLWRLSNANQQSTRKQPRSDRTRVTKR